MAKILQCWELGDGYAYVEGLSATSRMLKAAGHELALAYRDLKHGERLVGADFELFQAPTPVARAPVVLRRPMTFADQMINSDYGHALRMLGRLRAWRTLIDRYQPDVLRVLHSPGALLASRGLGIPTVVVGTGFLIPPAVTPLPNLRPWIKDADPKAMLTRETRVLNGMNQALTQLGAPPLVQLSDLYRADLQEIYTLPELDEYGPRAGVEYMGIYQPQSGDPPQWPEAKGKRVFAYLEQYKELPGILQALKESGAAVLVFLPGLTQELREKFEGGNLRFAVRPLNMLATAQQCDFGLSHGGHNIAGTLLLAGKPHLMVPMFLPERVAARKVAGLGAGLIAGLEPAKFAEALARFQAELPTLGARAAEFASKHKGFDSVSLMKRMAANIDGVVQKARSDAQRQRAS